MPYDGRSLFERLKEQKDKKEADYEETHKLSELWLQKIGSMFMFKLCPFICRELDSWTGR